MPTNKNNPKTLATLRNHKQYKLFPHRSQTEQLISSYAPIGYFLPALDTFSPGKPIFLLTSAFSMVYHIRIDPPARGAVNSSFPLNSPG